jgi:hypothetical protein
MDRDRIGISKTELFAMLEVYCGDSGNFKINILIFLFIFRKKN